MSTKKQEGKQRNERTDNEADDQAVAKKRRKAKGTRETRKRTRSEEGQSEAERHPKQPRRGKNLLKKMLEIDPCGGLVQGG